MKIDLEKLRETLKKEFGRYGEGRTHYVREDVPNMKIFIFLQHILDPLCIDELRFQILPDGEVVIDSFNYNNKFAIGKLGHPYKIILKDNTKPVSIDNIDSIDVDII